MTAHSITFMRCANLRVESHGLDNENGTTLELTHGGDDHWDEDKGEWVRAMSTTRIHLFGLPDDITTKLMALADDETTGEKTAQNAGKAAQNVTLVDLRDDANEDQPF